MKTLDSCVDKTFLKRFRLSFILFLTCNEQAVYDQDASPSLVRHIENTQRDQEE